MNGLNAVTFFLEPDVAFILGTGRKEGPVGGDDFNKMGTGKRNERGRAGSFYSEMYLASTVMVAASSVKGAIADPTGFEEMEGACRATGVSSKQQDR